MDDFPRNRRLFLIAALALGGACKTQSMPIVGVSAPRALEHEPAAADAEAPEPSPIPADFRAHMTRVRDRFLSRGHGEHFDVVVWANDAARPPEDARTPLPDGAVLVEEALVHDTRGDRAAGLFVMQKQGGVWRFDAVGPDGAVASRERVSACATCHRDAKDDVFR